MTTKTTKKSTPRKSKSKSSKKEKVSLLQGALGFIGVILFAVVMQVYTTFIWALMLGGLAFAVAAFFVGDFTIAQRLLGCAIGLAVAAIGRLLAHLLDKKLLNTLPVVSM